jgi:hypothetical protein
MSSPAPPSAVSCRAEGHEVRVAVAPDLVGLAESVGLPAVAYGPDARAWQDLHREPAAESDFRYLAEHSPDAQWPPAVALRFLRLGSDSKAAIGGPINIGSTFTLTYY